MAGSQSDLYSRLMNPLLATGRYLETVIHCDFLPLWGCDQQMGIRHLNNSSADHLNRLTGDIARVYGNAARPQHWSGYGRHHVAQPDVAELSAQHPLSEDDPSTEQATNALSCCAHTHALRPIF